VKLIGLEPSLREESQGNVPRHNANLANAVGAVKRLNGHNYNYEKTCMESDLQGHDLWEVIGGGKTTTPEVAGETLKK